MLPIKDFKELCVFLALSVTCEQKMLADGTLQLGDAIYAMSPLQALPAAISGVTDIPAQVKDMDPAEAKEVSDAVAAALDLQSDAAEGIVEQFMELGLQLAAAALAVKQAKAAVAG